MTASIELIRWQDAMRRAFALAKKGPLVNENPRVGCVLMTEDGTVVAEGYHRGAGSAHAEINALDHLKAKKISPRGLTAVVSLEPCRHTGRTGPCAEALIDAGVGRVIYGLSDPGGKSAGGAQLLASQGIDVVGPVLADEALDLVRHWYTATTLRRPFVTVKWAQSLDGRIAAADGTSQWITSPETRQRVHQDRSEHGAIIVGTETALVDNPRLTARDVDGELFANQPHAVVVGNREIPPTHHLHSHPGGFTHYRTHNIKEVLEDLFGRGIRSCYVEGGGTLVAAFVKDGLVDECHITMGPMLIGGPKLAVTDIGVTTLADAIQLDIADFFVTGGDIRVVARPRRHAPPSTPTREA